MLDKNASPHFRETFWYIVGISILIISYVVSVTFFNIPKDNSKYVDIAFGFLLNMLVQNASYLTGGNPTTLSRKNEENGINLPPENKSEVITTVKSEPINESKKANDGTI